MINSREGNETKMVSHNEDCMTRKTYQSPEVVDWGSLIDLTRGSIPDQIEDPDFSGFSSGI